MAGVKGRSGGRRPNQTGRPKRHDEDNARDLAIAAIVEVHGTLEAGLSKLVQSGEPSLIKFVYEHAIGKPKEKVEHSGDLAINWNEVKTYAPDEETD
jgi:hypothetical protein